MKIAVINGSPKGELSVTLQYIRYLSNNFPEHVITEYSIGKKIKSIENKSEAADEIFKGIGESDLIIWATPIYYLLVPAQLKRFIELIYERNATEFFKGKYAAAVTTSIHFFDHTAHDYLRGISEDLGMNFAGSFSAHSNDILIADERKNLRTFFKDIIRSAEEKRIFERETLEVPDGKFSYLPKNPGEKTDAKDLRVVLLHDADEGTNLYSMVKRMADSFEGDVDVRDIRNSGMKGGCLGCCRCAFDNVCVYSDGFTDFWKSSVGNSDILIMAGTVTDRYLSSVWKQFLDRSFFMGHVPYLKGKQIIYLVEGNLSYLPSLKECLVERVYTGEANPVGVITDETGDSAKTDRLIHEAAERSVMFARENYIPPAKCTPVGARKIFRDEIYGEMRSIFKADDRYYKKAGLYDFPTRKRLKVIKTSLFSLFLSIKPMQENVKKDMNKFQVKPMREIAEGAVEEGVDGVVEGEKGK